MSVLVQIASRSESAPIFVVGDDPVGLMSTTRRNNLSYITASSRITIPEPA